MKKFILLLLFFAAKNITSQNGWTTFTASVPSGTSASTENVLFIDNAGNKWVGFNGNISPSSLVIAKYNNASSSWTYWTKSAMGLSTGSYYVKAFAQDNLGNIWIGTAIGLIKYDGATFTLFNTTNGLPSNVISCLEFNNNMLYIGTGNGLSRYDGTTFTNYNIANTLFPIANVADIKAENANTLWAVSGNTLVSFYINSSFTTTSYTSTVAATSLYKIYIDAGGMKWISNFGGIIKYDNINFTYFNALYPNYAGTTTFDGVDIAKGPNNGILVTAQLNGPPYGRCLIEFLSSGNYNTFYSPTGSNIGTNFENDATGKLWMTGGVTSSTVTGTKAKIHEFNASVYSTAAGYWWGPMTTSNNYKYLDINRVKAGIMNRGDMWWDQVSGNASYDVPKGIVTGGVHGAFAASLWIGGLDASNQLHIAGQTYRQAGSDFWPGPLDTTNASIDSATVINYDKIWKVDYNDINTFITQFNLGNVPTSYTPTPDILSWPAKGTGAKSRNLAPFVDVNNNGIYDPLVGGDYPKIKGDQTLYFIFNDNFTSHNETGGLPMGIEVHAMAYAYGCPKILNGRNELAYTTFYDYQIYNRSTNNYNTVYMGLWTDVDLGDYSDDYIGSSPQNNLGFCYNADSLDNNFSSTNGYGSYPPAAGTTVLKGPMAPVSDGVDNDHDSIVDEAGEQCLLSYFDYYNNNIGSFPTQTTNPSRKYHYYNLLQGMWKDSTDHTCGGNAYGGTTKAIYDYPWSNYIGNPCGTWTELTAGNLAGDRRYIASSGPFNFPALSMTEVEYAYVWSVDSSAANNINIASANKLITDVQKIRSFYNSSPQNCLASINIGIKENELNNGQLLIYPNPASSVLFIKSKEAMGRSQIRVTDMLGKTVLESKTTDLYQTSINIEQLNSGIYFLNIKFDNNKSIVKKFVKQ